MFRFVGTIAKTDNRPVIIGFDNSAPSEVGAVVVPSEFTEDKDTIITLINAEMNEGKGVTLK